MTTCLADVAINTAIDLAAASNPLLGAANLAFNASTGGLNIVSGAAGYSDYIGWAGDQNASQKAASAASVGWGARELYNISRNSVRGVCKAALGNKAGHSFAKSLFKSIPGIGHTITAIGAVANTKACFDRCSQYK